MCAMMKELDSFLQSCPFRLYLILALVIAFLLGLCAAPRYYDQRKKQKDLNRWIRVGETIRCATWDALIHLVGFLLAPTLLLFVLVIISAASNSAEKIILGVLFLPLFFYMIFCVSGRGVDVLYQTTKGGIKSIHITLTRGMIVTFWPSRDKPPQSMA